VVAGREADRRAFRPTAEERTEAAEKKRTDTGESDPPYVLEEPWYRLDGDGYFGHQRYTLWVVGCRNW
jgi:hypothetical protein